MEDVKNTANSSEQISSEGTDVNKTNSYDDLFGDDKKMVPYNVFRERNLKLREAEKALKRMEENFEKKLQSEKATLYSQLQYEMQTKNKERDPLDDFSSGDDEFGNTKYDKMAAAFQQELDSLKQQIRGFQQKSEDSELTQSISQLKQTYPSLDEEHVYAIKKARPQWSLDECAEYSHKKWETKVSSMFNDLVEKRKEAAKVRPNVSEAIAGFVTKEKPKSAADASAKIREFINQYGG
jgi:hypothetical protein